MSNTIINIKETLTQAISQYEDLESQLLTAKSELKTESDRNSGLLDNIYEYEQKISSLESELSTAQFWINTLEREIEALKAQPVPPVIVISPDVEITILNQSFRPVDSGELFPLTGERRWTWNVNPEITLILDRLETQTRVTINRCWGDLPVTPVPPIISTHLKVVIDGKIRYDSPISINHHPRHTIVFDRLLLPLVTLDRLTPGLIPNYDITSITKSLSANVLNLISEGKIYSWRQWRDILPGTDPVTENFGYIINSWSGGAAPSANEASILAPWDVAYLLSTTLPSTTPDINSIRDRLYSSCLSTADSSGNYGIHFYNRESGRPHTPEDSSHLPVIDGEALPQLSTPTGLKLPKPDIAHMQGIANLAALLTRERYYIEELESWVFLGPLSRKGSDRASGIFWSGQVRAAVWWLRSVYHLSIIPHPGQGYYIEILRKNLKYILSTFCTPGGKEYRATGIVSIVPIRPSESTKYASSTAVYQTSTGNTYFLSHVVGEMMTHSDKDISSLAKAIVRHTSLTAKGTWEHSPSKYLIPWLQHALVKSTDDWRTIIFTTFANLPSLPTKFTSPVTIEMLSWWRAAVIAAIDAGGDGNNFNNTWAYDALKWCDTIAVPQSGKSLPFTWNIKPRSVKP